jgi:hypothetical protein
MATQDSMVAGLFSTPEQYQQQQRQALYEQAVQESKLDPYQQARVNLQTGVQGLAQAGAGMLGAEDPQMKAMSALRELASKYDTNTSGGVAALAQELQQRGMQQQAYQLGQQALAMREKEATIQTKTMERLTPEQKNAAGLADSAGLQRGTPAWAEKYSSELARLTTANKPNALPNIAKLQEYRRQAVTNGASTTELAQIDAVIKAEGFGKGTNIQLSPEIKMANQELDWRKQFLSENKPVIEQAANVQQALGLLQQSQQSPFADAAFANTVVSAFGGDKQKSKSEIDRLVKAGSLDERVANTVKGFFEGTTSAKTKEDQLKVLTAVDKVLEQRYNTSAKSWSDRLSKANVNPAMVVPAYNENVRTDSVSNKTKLPPEGTRLRNKTSGKIEVVRNGQLVPE